MLDFTSSFFFMCYYDYFICINVNLWLVFFFLNVECCLGEVICIYFFVYFYLVVYCYIVFVYLGLLLFLNDLVLNIEKLLVYVYGEN